MSLSSRQLNRFFLLISAGVLTGTSVYKFFYLLLNHKPAHLDPLLSISNHHLMLLGAVVEAVVVGIILFQKRIQLANLSLLWLSLCFLTYRIGMHLLYPDYECPCLGGISSLLPVDNDVVQNSLKAALGFFLVGSTFFLVQEIKSNGKKAPA